MTIIETDVDVTCFHCGLPCDEETIYVGEKTFCCQGCKAVYAILNANELCEYYDLTKSPGIKNLYADDENYLYLDDRKIKRELLAFDSPTYAKVIFYIPSIHCISCIWLLEHLQKMEKAILRSEVNFPRKIVTIDYNPSGIELSRIAGLLSALGYAPQIKLKNEEKKKSVSNELVAKLAIAGFCFGNVMMFSFPEYLGLDHQDESLNGLFSFLNFALAIPVLVFSGRDYFTSAFKSFKQKEINIDVPIAAGLAALFLRSSYDILSQSGPGYLDSFTGLVFFLLIGRWFQSKTYETLAFDRDFKSYFPLAVNKLMAGEWKPVVIYELRKNDIIKVRNMEIIPADSFLLSNFAFIDYSFVTGEAKPERLTHLDRVYAGGRLVGEPVQLKVEKETSQSHLTSLWNHDAFRKVEESRYKKIIDSAARTFTWIVLGIALATSMYWYQKDASEMWLVLTSVLMVACPCALALAAPFTYGNMLRVFGRNGLYLKNADVIERMAAINSVVFDKTGTVTYSNEPDVQFHGHLSQQELMWIKIMTSCSAHPLSNVITRSIGNKVHGSIQNFSELPGKGMQGWIENRLIKIGSELFVTGTTTQGTGSRVYVSIDGEQRGFFSIQISIRANIQSMLTKIGEKCKALLSGDGPADKSAIKQIFGTDTPLLFNQSPYDKLNFISRLQSAGQKVMMVGDGLNDAGALKQSNVGIAVTDDTGVFTPACDGILMGSQLQRLDQFLDLAKASSSILKTGFVISFFYNTIALSFAVSGHLTPLVAAILMPISSISVVSFSTLAVNLVARKKFKPVGNPS
jgi:Cu+-exporting ATPase